MGKQKGFDFYGVITHAFDITVGNAATQEEAKAKLKEAFEQAPHEMLDFLQNNTSSNKLDIFTKARIDGVDLTINAPVRTSVSVWPTDGEPLTEEEYRDAIQFIAREERKQLES